ncbi:MAG TPA: hypothetical protein VE621_14315, partial [Bryobacteraceae bacterium]|nr:hypothetical protein [Bryobacteraceae bacterium]
MSSLHTDNGQATAFLSIVLLFPAPFRPTMPMMVFAIDPKADALDGLEISIPLAQVTSLIHKVGKFSVLYCFQSDSRILKADDTQVFATLLLLSPQE